MLAETPLAVLRLYELAQVLGTLFGALLVVRYGRTKFLAGLYTGCISIFFWDWIFTDSWFFNLTYDARSITLFTLDGRPEPLWSPCSYATFFGVTTLLLLRYRASLDARLGRKQYLFLPVFFAVLDVVVEGFVVSVLKIYRYGYQDQWTIFGIPYTNLIWVNIILLLMFWLAKGCQDLWARATTPPRARPIGAAAAPIATEPWAMFGMGFAICPAAFYVGVTVIAFALHRIQPWT